MDVDRRSSVLYCMAARLARAAYRSGAKTGLSMLLFTIRGKTVAGASYYHGPSFLVVPKAPDSVILTLFEVSKCLDSMKSPATFTVSVRDPEAAANYIIDRYAGDIVALGDLARRVKEGKASLREKLYYRLHKSRVEEAMKIDALERAVERCRGRILGSVKSRVLRLALRTLSRALDSEGKLAIYFDGEPSIAALVENQVECPRYSMLYFDPESMVAAVAIDTAYPHFL